MLKTKTPFSLANENIKLSRMIFFQHCFPPLSSLMWSFHHQEAFVSLKRTHFYLKWGKREMPHLEEKDQGLFSTCPKEKMPKISLSLPSLEMNVYLGSSWWWWYYRNSNLLMDNLANKNIVYNFLTLWLPFKNLHPKFQIWWWKPLKWGFKFSF